MANEKIKIQIGLVMEQTNVEGMVEVETRRTADYYEVSEVLDQVEKALTEALEDDQIISFSAEIVPVL